MSAETCAPAFVYLLVNTLWPIFFGSSIKKKKKNSFCFQGDMHIGCIQNGSGLSRICEDRCQGVNQTFMNLVIHEASEVCK